MNHQVEMPQSKIVDFQTPLKTQIRPPTNTEISRTFSCSDSNFTFNKFNNKVSNSNQSGYDADSSSSSSSSSAKTDFTWTTTPSSSYYSSKYELTTIRKPMNEFLD